jgi:phospholipid/cholesterol/gamma-HCH transport system substrate-binding protein
MVDSAQAFIEEAQANESPTVDLLHNAQTVLQTQADNAANIRAFSRDLAALTGTVASSDANIRKILNDAGPAADELVLLVRDLRRLLPSFLTHTVNVTEVLDARLPALEQLLVTFPRLVSAGPSALLEGAEGDPKFGRVNLNLNFVPEPCTDGYLPPGQWRPPADETFEEPDPDGKTSDELANSISCESGPPINMRGTKYAPEPIDWKSEDE